MTTRKSIFKSPARKNGGKSGMLSTINQRVTNSEHRKSCDTIRKHQDENVFPKSRQKHSRSEKQARKEHMGKEEQ